MQIDHYAMNDPGSDALTAREKRISAISLPTSKDHVNFL
jgi:hypothetical protein